MGCCGCCAGDGAGGGCGVEGAGLCRCWLLSSGEGGGIAWDCSDDETDEGASGVGACWFEYILLLKTNVEEECRVNNNKFILLWHIKHTFLCAMPTQCRAVKLSMGERSWSV